MYDLRPIHMYQQRLNKISAIKAFTLIKAIIARKVIKTNKPRSIAIVAPKASIAITLFFYKKRLLWLRLKVS